MARQPVFAIRGIQIEGEVARNSESTIRANAVHRLAGFTVAHVEPSPYTAAYAILPGFRQALAQLLGPRFRICLAVENMLAAYTPNGAAYNLAHEEELAQDLIEMIRAEGDPSKPLPFTGPAERARPW